MDHPGKLGSSTYFIADLHLDPERQRTVELSLAFFEQVRDAKALYILGDLFEYWIGDDAGMAQYPEIIQALAAISTHGCQLTVMLGNRDFLLGQQFANAVGAALVIEDELLINLDEDAVLLMHGDTLCTDDDEYQSFREQVRDRHWQQQFLSRTITERQTYAEHLRKQSRERSAGKAIELMDVNDTQVQSTIKAHNCKVLIHGHTHRPAIHSNELYNTRRLVVGDWHDDHACYVVHDNKGLHLRHFRGQLDTPVPSA